MAIIGIEVFHLFFFCIEFVCEWCCLGDGSSKISLLGKGSQMALLPVGVDQKVGIITTCLCRELTHVSIKNRGPSPFHIVCQTYQCGVSTSSLFCRLVAVMVQLDGGYVCWRPKGCWGKIRLSAGHRCCERRVLMAVEASTCFKMDISI